MKEIGRKTLYYLTASYPYGISEQWKKNELEILKKYFDIIVIPHTYGGNHTARNLVDGVEYREPLVKNDDVNTTKVEKILSLLPLFFSPSFMPTLLKEIVVNKLYLSSKKLKIFLGFCLIVSSLKKNKAYRQLLLENKPDVIFYYFWGIGSVTLLPFMKKSKVVSLCRFLGWDMYSERHPGNYIPFQEILLRRLNLVLPCSDSGKKYLAEKLPFVKGKLETARLATLTKGENPFLDDNRLKIVTCSFAVPVKRLDILCKALLIARTPIHWTHIGGGPLLDELKNYARSFPPNVEAHFTGTVESTAVPEIYKEQSFDLFLNLSESEGVPVAVMEAFAASIPVYATDVGGTSEIVNNEVGKLLPANISPEHLAILLREFHGLTNEEKLRLRKNAFARYKDRCDAHVNAEKLAKLMSAI